jgi:methionyl-tRNA formyltransferase
MLDLVFMGTAPFAVPCLEAVLAAGHRVTAVVTQPDRPHGRGMQLQPSAVKRCAQAHGLPVFQPERASRPAFVEQLRALQPQALVVVAYGQILRTRVLEIPSLGCVNVHGSLLPELRGAAPIQWAILRGYKETGVTTMFMDAGMDTGPMILKEPVEVLEADTSGMLAAKLAPVGSALLVETLSLLEAGRAPQTPQDAARATYAPMLQREDGAVRWDWTAAEIRNRIHGCNPAPGAFARRDERTVKLWRAEVVDGPGAAPGTVVDARRLILATGSGAIRLLEVQPESRARLEGEAYGRGHQVREGEIWQNGMTDADAADNQTG